MLVFDQVAAVTTGATKALVVPGGPTTVTLSNAGANPVFVGTSSTVTTSTGFMLPTGAPPVTLTTFESSPAQTLWVISSVGASSLSWVISTAH